MKGENFSLALLLQKLQILLPAPSHARQVGTYDNDAFSLSFFPSREMNF